MHVEITMTCAQAGLESVVLSGSSGSMSQKLRTQVKVQIDLKTKEFSGVSYNH